MILLLGCRGVLAQDTITVTTDRSSFYLESKFQIGVTHVQSNWQNGNASAVARAKQNLVNAPVTLQNVHIMGWGPISPSPSPGEYSWGSLDQRINLMRSMNAEMILTFCTAPGWMKRSGQDWEMNDRVADEHFEDYAELCKVAALRYPDIKYFQIWNEFKGFWSNNPKGWDVAKYTEFYNIVYDSVRSARPDASIGGFYKGFNMTNGGVLSANDLYMIDYWLDNNVGADFISFDGSVHGWPHVSAPEQTLMNISSCFGNIASKIREKTDLPIWVSEYYAANLDGDAQFQAANHASAYYHSLISGTSVALHWDPIGFAPIVTNTNISSGGQTTPHYTVVSYYNKYFGPGRKLYKTSCSDSKNLDVLASATKTLLINKQAKPVHVMLDGELITLDRYEFRLYERKNMLDIVENESKSLSDLVMPFSLLDTTLSLSSNNTTVASIDESGLLSAQIPGTAVISVSTGEFGFNDTFEIVVTVQNDTIESNLSLALNVGESNTLSSIIRGLDPMSDSVNWSLSDDSVISISDDGIIKALSSGTTEINIEQRDSLQTHFYTISVSVKQYFTAAPFDIELYVGEADTLSEIIEGLDPMSDSVIWSISDSSVISISDAGIINALSLGTTEISIAQIDGLLTYLYTIIVNVQQLIISTSFDFELTEGDTVGIHDLIDSLSFTNSSTTWESEDSTIASIDEYGIISAFDTGNVILTITTKENGIIYVFTINVTAIEKETFTHKQNIFANEIKIYPNPLGNLPLTIDLGTISEASIAVLGIEGKKVYSKKVYDNKVIIPAGVLSPGMYIISIGYNDKVKIEKLIVQ